MAFAPLAAGFSESGESLQVSWKVSEDEKSLGLKRVDSTTCAWVLQLLVWAQPLLTRSTDLKSLVDGHICRIIEFWQHKLVEDQSDQIDEARALCESITKVTNSPSNGMGLKLHMIEVLSGSALPFSLRAAVRGLSAVVTCQAAYQDMVMTKRYEVNQVDDKGSIVLDMNGCMTPSVGLHVQPPTCEEASLLPRVFEELVKLESAVFPTLMTG